MPYQQTEVFRFGNPIVDEWEGKVNAWPLDEGLIDYVDAGYGGATDENPYAALNVIANPSFTLSGGTVDAAEITPELLESTLQEADAIESNVATGYHAIEFLLWGQDLNGTGPGAGNRPWTDYAAGDACTGGNCDRRAAYLKAATDLLISDLEWIVAQWADGGAARTNVTVDPDARHRRGADRHGQPQLRRAGGRADAAGADAARPGGGARLLLGQHLQQPFLRRRGCAERLSRALRADRRQRGGGAVGVASWWRRRIRRSTPSFAARSPTRCWRSAPSRRRARRGRTMTSCSPPAMPRARRW